MIKQSLCQERRDFEMFRLFFSNITQTVRIIYIFFSIFYHLFSFYHGFCAGSMNFSQLYVVFLSIFFHVQILFNFIFAVNAKKTRLCNRAPSGPITLHGFSAFTDFSLSVKISSNYSPAFLAAASTTWLTSTEVVTLPTPPGTGVIASTIGSTAA